MKKLERLKTETVKFRLTKNERDKLQSYAETRGWTMTQVIQEYIRRLPKASESEGKNI